MTLTAPTSVPSVAIVHDYFTQRGGAEKVAGRLARIFPAATVHTSVFDPSALPAPVAPAAVHATPLQLLRSAGLPLRMLWPLLPAAFGRLDVGASDVVISSSSAFAHHVRPNGGTVHVCYCHTPPRFLWKVDEYFHDLGAQRRLLAPALALHRRVDAEAAGRVDVYVANSRFTAETIRRAYGRSARVIYPPVDTTAFAPSPERSGRFLIVARLKRHKRIELAIAAAGRLGVPLDVIGDGPERERLQRMAGPTVRLLGWQPDEVVRRAMATCEGLIAPGLEDFGLTMAEAQAAGRPPIALADGGATEIIRDGETGFLFPEQTPEAVGEAMRRAMTTPLDARALVRSARRFDAAAFDRAMRDLVVEVLTRREDVRQRREALTRSLPAAAAAPLAPVPALPIVVSRGGRLAPSGAVGDARRPERHG